MSKENPEKIFYTAVSEKMDIAQGNLKKLELEHEKILEKFKLLITEIENKKIQIAEQEESSLGQYSKREIEKKMMELREALKTEYEKSLASLNETEKQLGIAITRMRSIEAMVSEHSERN